MRKNFTIFMITLLVSLLSGTASAQRLAVKSNLLYDITSTINLGVEYEVAPVGRSKCLPTTIRGASRTIRR